MEMLTARELAEYEILEAIDPEGPVRGDLQAGMLAAVFLTTIREILGGGKATQKPITPDAFLLFDVDRQAEKPARPSPAELKSKILAGFLAMGAKVIDKRGNSNR